MNTVSFCIFQKSRPKKCGMCSGMPEAVSTFLTTHDVNQMVAVQRAIIDEYKVDMVKYARSEDKSRIRECFESIPRQLSRDNIRQDGAQTLLLPKT